MTNRYESPSSRCDRYVVITAARNEERHIGATAASLAAQTIKPVPEENQSHKGPGSAPCLRRQL